MQEERKKRKRKMQEKKVNEQYKCITYVCRSIRDAFMHRGAQRARGEQAACGPAARRRQGDTPGEPCEWAARGWRGGYTGNAVGVGGPGGRCGHYG